MLEDVIPSTQGSTRVPLDDKQCAVLDKSLYKRNRVSISPAAPGAVSAIISGFSFGVVGKHLRLSHQFSATLSHTLLAAIAALEEHLTEPALPPGDSQLPNRGVSSWMPCATSGARCILSDNWYQAITIHWRFSSKKQAHYPPPTLFMAYTGKFSTEVKHSSTVLAILLRQEVQFPIEDIFRHPEHKGVVVDFSFNGIPVRAVTAYLAASRKIPQYR